MVRSIERLNGFLRKEWNMGVDRTPKSDPDFMNEKK
jgi:hypothetical protein